MELIKKNFWSFSLLSVFLFCLYLPIAFTLSKWSLSLQWEELNLTFFQLLFHALKFCLLQSFLSALLVAFLSSLLTYFCLSSPSKAQTTLRNITNKLGIFCFLLPQISVALLIIEKERSWSSLPTSGLWAVVIAHLLLNVLFVSSQLNSRLHSWIRGEGHELSLYLESLPMHPLRRFTLLVQRPLLDELKTWIPLVFLWSSSAFATVLLLGGHPRNTSPEHLLFYSLSEDPFSSRSLILFLVQIGIGLLALSFTQKKKAHQHNHIAPLSKKSSPPLSFESKYFSLFVLIAILWIFFSLLSAPLSRLEFLSVLWQDKTSILWQAALHSFALATLSATFSLAFSLAYIVSSSVVRKVIYFSAAFSSSVVMSSWLFLRIDTWFLQNESLQFFVAALLISVLSFPFFSVWLKNGLSTLSKELEDYCQCLGVRGLAKLRYYWIPQMAPLIKKILIVSFIGALGEVVVSSLLVKNTPLLSVLGRMATSRYDFQTGYSVLAIIFFSTLVLSLFMFPSRRTR